MLKRAVVCLCLPLLLLGCGPGRNEFAPPCPAPVLLPTVADLTRYSPTATTHDLTQLVVQARIESLNGSCKAGDDASTIDTTVRIGLSIQRGPAMQGRDVDLPVFLAVTLGNDVRTKQIFPVHITFPPNVDHLAITSADIALTIPVSDKVTGASYGLIAGFQLTPDELAANRAARQGK
jgi:hypothetical protein